MPSLLTRVADTFSIGQAAKSRKIQTKADAHKALDLQFIQAMPRQQQADCLTHLPSSQSQLRQDLFALSVLDFMRNGFFVEFGATDGKTLSNTHLMEKEFDWRGILAEPATGWHDALYQNRCAAIETDCVWGATGETLRFTETPRKENSGFSPQVSRSRRMRGSTYTVKTISLNDLLGKFQAPPVIDYISIDTEGSEFEILNNFDFTKYKFRVMTVEHNFAPQRAHIHDLLSSHGYKRVFEKQSRFDDWYVLDV